MADAKVGSLRVDLGLNSAQFQAGLKGASDSLKVFGVQLTYSLNGIAYQVGRLIGAFPSAIKGAIDHADALSKAAQKAGVTVEALSRLSYAAQFSEVSLEDVTASLGKLSKTMAEATQNTHGAQASAFAALGISVTDASGKLRSADAVFSEVADRFSRLQDGATKTAISMALFGKSGAQLIPLLNEGATGLKRYADESDRLGNTISSNTANAANRFNDTLTKIGTILGGVTNRVMEAALPALQQLADTLSSPAFVEAATVIGTNLVKAVNLLAVAFENAVTWGGKLLGVVSNLGVTQAGAGEDALVRRLGLTRLPTNASGSPDDRDKSGMVPITIHGGSTDTAPINTSLFTEGLAKGAEEAAKKAKLLKGALDDIGPAGKTAADMASKSLRDLGDNAFGSLANLSGALSGLFKQNKAFAVATAVLQGLQGVAYALGSSAPPWNFINAAAVGIEAAANVANILATNENSTSMPSSGGGGTAATAATASAPSLPAISLTLKGSNFSAKQVEDLIDQINEHLSLSGKGFVTQ